MHPTRGNTRQGKELRMKSHRYRLLSRVLLAAIIAMGMLMAYGMGAVVGKYRPALAKPFSDWAMALVKALRDYGINASVFPAVASICFNLGSDTIRAAQRTLPERIAGVHPGPDTDSLSDMRDRFDYCHFSERGLQAHAEMLKEVILSFEQGRQ
jgi:hypothetical protein